MTILLLLQMSRSLEQEKTMSVEHISMSESNE